MAPRWKSSTAWASSARVFMTNGPYWATGSRMGCPPRTSTSRSGLGPSPDGAALGADGPPTRQHVDEPVEVGPPRQPELGPGRQRGVEHGDRRVGHARAGVSVEVAGDEPHQRPAVGRGEQRDVARPDVLVAGGDHLVPGGQ